MKEKIKKLTGSQIEAEISISQEEFNRHFHEAEEEVISKVSLKGFRPGTAPRELCLKAIDRERVFEAAAEAAVRSSLREISEDHGWILVDKPKAEILEATPLTSAGEARGPGLRYKTTLTVFPEVAIGDYKKIAKKVLAEKKEVVVGPEEIEKTLGLIRDSRAKLTRVIRGSQKGDLVELDIKSSVEGVVLPGGEIKGDRFVLGESRFIPGFDEKIISHGENERLEFSLTAPQDYWEKSLRSKKIDFKVRIAGVFERELAALDDAFAQRLGPNFKNISDLKNNIGDGLRLEQEEKETERIRARIIEEIVRESKIDPPQIMIEKTLDQMVTEVKQMMGRRGAGAPDEAELRKGLADKARERLLANLVVQKIVATEHLEPTKEEVEAESRKRRLDPQVYYDYSYGIVQQSKLFQFLEKQS